MSIKWKKHGSLASSASCGSDVAEVMWVKAGQWRPSRYQAWTRVEGVEKTTEHRTVSAAKKAAARRMRCGR